MSSKINNPAILCAQDLSVGYNRPILKDLSLDLHRGELVCLIGPNGAGKSTLLRTLSGMRKPVSGVVRIDGLDITTFQPIELARQLAIVLTERVEVGNLNAYSLVSLGRYPYTAWHGGLTPDDDAIILRALEQTGALSLATRSVFELSDGERQKVMIARALAQQPKVLMLDEPTAFLDLPRRVELFRLLRELARETGTAILLSTHDLDLALRVADRLWLLSNTGEFHSGIPEELALHGQIASVFSGEGVQFDHASGAFRVQQPKRGAVSLKNESDGVAFAWTWRALERCSLQPRENDPNLPIQITVKSSRHWQMRAADSIYECETLSELLALLKG